MLLYDGRSCIDVDECLSLDNVENNKISTKIFVPPAGVQRRPVPQHAGRLLLRVLGRADDGPGRLLLPRPGRVHHRARGLQVSAASASIIELQTKVSQRFLIHREGPY